MVGTQPSPTRARETTVGALLIHAREARGLTLEDIAQQLRIPRAQLASLEAGDLSVFAAEVYARGAFLKYAGFLGIHAESTTRAFLRTLSDSRKYIPLKVHTPRPWLERFITPRWILAGIVALIALAVGTYIVWQVQSFLRVPALKIDEPLQAIVLGANVTVRGQAEEGSHVTVNDEAVLLTDNGLFETRLSLHPGINVLRVVAENAAGRQRIMTRHLLMPRQ